MTRLALVRISDGAVVAAPIAPGDVVVLPGVGQVSPAMAGWQGGGVISYGEAGAIEGPAQYRLVAVRDFAVPDGKQISGAAAYSYDGTSVSEAFPTEDIPPPPAPPTPAERLAAAGLTVDDLNQLLGLP